MAHRKARGKLKGKVTYDPYRFKSKNKRRNRNSAVSPAVVIRRMPTRNFCRVGKIKWVNHIIITEKVESPMRPGT